jgi:hypothetical protein
VYHPEAKTLKRYTHWPTRSLSRCPLFSFLLELCTELDGLIKKAFPVRIGIPKEKRKKKKIKEKKRKN